MYRLLACFMLLSLFCRAEDASRSVPPQNIPAELQGCWEDVASPSYRMWFQPQCCIQFSKNHYAGDFALLAAEGKLTLGLDVQKREIAYSIKDGVLEISVGNEQHKFKKLDKIPDECTQVLQPMKLGAPEKLSDERIEAICADLEKHLDADQEARHSKDPKERQEAMRKVDPGNHEWMKKLVQEVGWIDADRFGDAAEHDACLMMMHYCHDWPLVLAILPQMKKDVIAAKFDALSYSMLHDRLCWIMGRKAYYGQITFLVEPNKAEFGPFEDFSKANEYRKEIGLPSVEDEIAKFRKENPAVELKLIKE